jgi:hypothetical protein
LPHLLWDASDAFGFDHPDGEASESGDIFWAMAGADAAAVFVIVPIDVVATIFD